MGSNENKNKSQTEMGSVTMALVTFLPLLIAGLFGLGVILIAIYQRTVGDRICKTETMKLQHELSRIVKELTKLNRSATSLRIQRTAADAARSSAIASGLAPAIAAAEAARLAVIAAQTAFAARQKSLILEAGLQRFKSKRTVRGHVGKEGLKRFDSSGISSPSVALIAIPENSFRAIA